MNGFAAVFKVLSSYQIVSSPLHCVVHLAFVESDELLQLLTLHSVENSSYAEGQAFQISVDFLRLIFLLFI